MSGERLSRRELRRLLREAAVPSDGVGSGPEAEERRRGAEERGLDVVLAAYAERSPRRRSPLPRLAISFAVAAILAALLLTPAWAAVRDWVGGVFESTPAQRAPAGELRPIPSGGRLLVQSEAGPWVVRADGSRHRLGSFSEASWSPHGLYVAAVRGDELSALTPEGEAKWVLRASGPVGDPRWAPSGHLVAFRAGDGLRVVAGDGSEDRPLDESVAPVGPAWSPPGAEDLAYVDVRGALRVVDAATGAEVGRAKALYGITGLEWGSGNATGARPGAGLLLEASRRRLRVRSIGAGITNGLGDSARGGAAAGAGAGTAAGAGTGVRGSSGAIAADRNGSPAAAVRVPTLPRPRSLPVPAGETVRDAALSPDGRTVAALLVRRGPGRRTDLVLYSTADRTPRRLGSVPGRLTELAWSPDGRRLLVAWPSYDEWLFVPPRAAEGRALTGIAQAFTPQGTPRAFPTVSGWCCRLGPR